jgi:hypothetical protein
MTTIEKINNAVGSYIESGALLQSPIFITAGPDAYRDLISDLNAHSLSILPLTTMKTKLQFHSCNGWIDVLYNEAMPRDGVCLFHNYILEIIKKLGVEYEES